SECGVRPRPTCVTDVTPVPPPFPGRRGITRGGGRPTAILPRRGVPVRGPAGPRALGGGASALRWARRGGGPREPSPHIPLPWKSRTDGDAQQNQARAGARPHARRTGGRAHPGLAQRDHRHRDAGRGRRRARAVPARRVLLGHAGHHRVRAVRHAGRRGRPRHREDLQVRRVPGLHDGPGRRRRDLLRADDRAVPRRAGAARRRRPVLPGRRGRGVLRQGPRRGARLHLRRGHRRTRRTTDRRPGGRRVPRPRRPLRPRGRAVGPRRPQHGHGRAAVRRRPRPGQGRRGQGRREDRAGAGPMSDPGPPERRGGGRTRRAAARAPLRDEVMDAAYAAGWTIVRKIPEPAARLAFAALADRTWHRYGAGVRQLEKNLCRVLGKHEVDDEVRILSKKVLRSYFRYWLEVFRLPEYSRERILGRMRVTGEKKIFSSLEAGRGVILALPHMGNYEHAGAWLVHRGYPFTTVAERLRPESLFDRFVAFREGLGMEVLPHKGASAYGRMAQRLRAGRPVCLVV